MVAMTFEELTTWAEEEAQSLKSQLKPRTVRNLVFKPNVKRKLLASQSSPTTYIVNKGESRVNDESIQVENVADMGNSTVNDDAIPVKKFVDKGKSKMIEDDHPV
ncbi:hypothetical protein CTI12_AA097530 [Artemisia annua]|uniref:Uncharacterized protein n=1 Tax=Artemisia annua TaxID=35608 RepID=A0A2U1PY88_ARTAN|nr:hypothetical protein CTI12_AA097530 [Artemisia annua]